MTTNKLDAYLQAEKDLKTEAVGIINFLSDWCEDPEYQFCDIEHYDMYINTGEQYFGLYSNDGNNSWSVPNIYFSMGDGDILTHAKNDFYQRYKDSEQSQVDKLRSDALLYGYELVKLDK